MISTCLCSHLHPLPISVPFPSPFPSLSFPFSRLHREKCLMPLSYRHLRVIAPRPVFLTRPLLTRAQHPHQHQHQHPHLHVLADSLARRPLLTGRPAWRVRDRGKKTKASVKLDDLPQGVIPLESLPLEDDVPAYPTVVRQARSNMQKFENCVLLTRVGGFYELYFEHADEFAPLLNIKPAKKFTNAGYVSMVIRPSFLQQRNAHI